ncbi:sodium/solute symporter [Ruficoccus amylovorans]|uniref:Sodium/solute symporter n=1 Tax=Ruficoccus amylovorans TaxID=1804625 RepID=A0A842HGE4_9BACT|nr:sodium/solute symporter [Ruficoccus amylovorans]MBC2595250.1 sodium/solute symporter [Ruficoccus amylovorans]
MKIGPVDICVLVIYFIIQIGIGVYVGRKNKSSDQYFLGGKSFGGFVIGISFIGSVISSVTFIATPADGFKTAWLRFMPNLAFPIVTLLAAWLLVPFFRRGTITSAYQYLSLRFHNSISTYASIIFIGTQLLRTSMITYLLSLLVAEMTGLTFAHSVLLVVGVTAVYTVKGGLSAVIWTDVIQTIVLLGSAIVCIGLIIYHVPGGLGGIIHDGMANNKFSFFDFDLETRGLVATPWFGGLSEKTVLLIIIVGLMQYLNLQFDQSTVQRWCSAKSAWDARKSMIVLSIGALPIWAMFYFLGSCLFVYFLHNPSDLADAVLQGYEKAERILPYFIMNHLPVGIVGLMIAGAMAAAMSTLSACINVTSMVSVNDLYVKYINPRASGKHQLILGKSLSILVSVFMIGGALGIEALDVITLTDFLLAAGVVITIGIPAIFIAGMFTRRVCTVTIWLGLAPSIFLMLWSMASSTGYLPDSCTIHIPLYYLSIIGNVLTLTLALLLSLFIKPKPRDLTDLTIWDQSKDSLE